MNKQKILIMLVAGLFAIAGLAIASTTYTNSLNQVVTVDANGVVTSIVDSSGPASSTNRVTGQVGIQIDDQGAAALDPTTHTPRGIGDVLFYLNSNKVYNALGDTTNDWVLLN